MSKIVNMKCISYNGTFPIQSSTSIEFVPTESISSIQDNCIIAILRVKLNFEVLIELRVYMDTVYDADRDNNVVRLIISDIDKNDGVIAEYRLPVFDLISFNSRCREYAIYALSKELNLMICTGLPLYVMDAGNKMLEVTPAAIMPNQLYTTFDTAIKALYECNAGRGSVSCR